MTTPSAPDSLFLDLQQALVGRYSLERELGRGGMGVVYLAREVRLDRPVAIKLLPPELAAHANLRERFMREARLAARLSHPYIVPIHTVDEIGGFVFYVMAYVDGETLGQRVQAHGPLPAHDVTRVLREVAWALAYAHAQGIVHRDIKPANIMLERGTARAMVMDFGIARLANLSGETAVGEVMGTPEYMSPEQSCGEVVDGRSDLYSLGVVGFHALTGLLPFTGSPQEVLAQQVTKPAPPAATLARGAPRTLTAVVDRCLMKSPAERFGTGEELADALAQSLDRRPEMPVPLRVFLDRRRMAVVAAPVAIGLGMLVAVVGQMTKAGAIAPHLALAITDATLIVVVPIIIIVKRLRQLLRHGYGVDDITAALRQSFERRREEFQYEFGIERGRREKMFRALAIGGWGVAGGATIAALSGVVLAGVPLWPVALFGAYFGVLGTLVSRKWRRLREGAGPAWGVFWSGPIGRGVVKLASIRLGARAIPADRPTALGIAMSAEQLFSALPRETRKTLGDVPAVLHELEAHARGIRARIEQLDQSLAEAGNSGASARSGTTQVHDRLVSDLRAARATAEQRLADVVTSLETLRLDLLRLRADAGATESVTQDVARAQELGVDVDRLLAGSRDVRAALQSPPTPSPS